MERKELKVLRIRNGLSQVEMAKRLGVSAITYNRIEKGHTDGQVSFWVALQNEFNLPGDYVWSLQNQKIKK